MKTNHGLTTDLYQLTMAAAYLREFGENGRVEKRATFDLFVRSLPRDWKYLIACGIEEAIDCLRDLRFTPRDVKYLAQQGFSRSFCNYLLDFRFRGSVYGVLEGTPFFANEPILEVEGNLIEAQIVETLLLSIINYQTLIASKASRVVQAAGDLPVVDFGLRRAPGPEAGIRAARAAFIAGAVSTSNVEAGRLYGIPVKGTHAHSYVMAHETELEAFKAWCAANPDGTSLLIDTYDVEEGARNVVRAVRSGCAVDSVRIDSGNLETNTKAVRAIFDEAGLRHIRILVSGDLNEDKVGHLRIMNEDIGGFGVGTDMVTARPESALGGVYKLVEIAGRPVIKLAEGKTTWPGKKQIWRCLSTDGKFKDVIGAAGEDPPSGFTSVQPLLVPLMLEGKVVKDPRPLSEIVSYRRDQLERINPDGSWWKAEYPVDVSDVIREKKAEAERRLRGEKEAA
jgi:nicotinate phosphoribosyltransferase